VERQQLQARMLAVQGLEQLRQRARPRVAGLATFEIE
jgi:hypothetical protein